MKRKTTAKATSRASVSNSIKIVLADRKKRRTRRRKRTTKSDSTMELLTALASRPSMRPVQPLAQPEKEQNNLATSALVASNAGVIQALNNLSQATFLNGGLAPAQRLNNERRPQPTKGLTPPSSPVMSGGGAISMGSSPKSVRGGGLKSTSSRGADEDAIYEQFKNEVMSLDLDGLKQMATDLGHPVPAQKHIQALQNKMLKRSSVYFQKYMAGVVI